MPPHLLAFWSRIFFRLTTCTLEWADFAPCIKQVQCSCIAASVFSLLKHFNLNEIWLQTQLKEYCNLLRLKCPRVYAKVATKYATRLLQNEQAGNRLRLSFIKANIF